MLPCAPSNFRKGEVKIEARTQQSVSSTGKARQGTAVLFWVFYLPPSVFRLWNFMILYPSKLKPCISPSLLAFYTNREKPWWILLLFLVLPFNSLQKNTKDTDSDNGLGSFKINIFEISILFHNICVNSKHWIHIISNPIFICFIGVLISFNCITPTDQSSNTFREEHRWVISNLVNHYVQPFFTFCSNVFNTEKNFE